MRLPEHRKTLFQTPSITTMITVGTPATESECTRCESITLTTHSHEHCYNSMYNASSILV